MKVADVVQNFEASLMILRMSKEGWVVGFSVHPDEIPELLLRVKLGTRYQVALVQIGDDEEPTLPDSVIREDTPGVKAVRAAGELCRNSNFQEWMLAGDSPDDPESESAKRLRDSLGILSRSELAVNDEARDALYGIIRKWKGDLDIDI